MKITDAGKKIVLEELSQEEREHVIMMIEYWYFLQKLKEEREPST